MKLVNECYHIPFEGEAIDVRAGSALGPNASRPHPQHKIYP